MTEFIQVVTTADSRENAVKIAEKLLKCRLAGCAQVSGPITSSYWWEGRIETSEEWYCVIKTEAGLYKDVEREIISVHPYEVPEILALPVIDGSKSYLDWLEDVVIRRPNS